MRNRFNEQLEQLNVELIKMGALCEEAISAAAAQGGQGGGMTMGDENCLIQINGGYLVVNAAGDGVDSNGSVEVNGTFETLVRFQKGTMASEVAKILFPEG